MIAEHHYRCYFVDPSPGFVGSEEFQATNDRSALERCMALLHKRGLRSVGFELWQADRLIHRQEPIDRRR